MTRDYAEFGRKGELEPIGVVDIGSNSVRLVIYEGAVRSPTPIFNEKVLCGLGRYACATLLKHPIAIMKIRGTWDSYQGLPLFICLHPSATLHQQAHRSTFDKDIATLAKACTEKLK